MKTIGIWAIVLCLGCCSCAGSGQSSPAPLPEISHIKRIHIKWHEVADGDRPTTKQFDVADHFDELIDALKPNRIESAIKGEIAGQLKIDQDNDYPISIKIFWTAGETLAFQIGPIYYSGGSKNKLSAAIRERRPR